MATISRIDREARARARDLVHTFAGEPSGDISPRAVRIFLERADDYFRWCIENTTDDTTRIEWRVLALRNSLPAFTSLRAGSVPVTATALVSALVDAAHTLHVRPPRVQLPREGRELPKPSVDAVITFDTGLLGYVVEIKSTHNTAAIIRRLMVHLHLSYDELGRMVGITGETVRRWEQGHNMPSPEKQAMLTTADSALSRLLGVIKPEALPAVVWRTAEAFDNERAIDWILRGRIADVADRYERELSYQG